MKHKKEIQPQFYLFHNLTFPWEVGVPARRLGPLLKRNKPGDLVMGAGPLLVSGTQGTFNPLRPRVVMECDLPRALHTQHETRVISSVFITSIAIRVVIFNVIFVSAF